jgi:hypothetical protein
MCFRLENRIMARQLSDMESIAHVRADDVLIN